MSIQFKCDGCGRIEPGIWRYGHDEILEDEHCLATCGEKFTRVHYSDSECLRPLVDADKSGGGDHWWTREDQDGQQHACSRECIDKIAEKFGVSRVIMPW